ASNTRNEGDGSDKQAEVQPVNAGQPAQLSKITRVPYDPNLFIPENTAIKCSLDRRFISDLAGKLVCTINEDVYSANRNVKLIEKGTAAYLMYKTGTFNHGQGAVFIAATKLRTRKEPFIDIPLIDTQAAGALGEAGASGWIDTHFADRFMGAMMVGMIPDVAQAASGAAKSNKDNQTDYTANSRQAFADIAREAFANSVNIPPTLYKNQGEIITLIVGQDLDFSSIYKLKMVGTRR
ncbi:TPA: VirB10/TraB/TrbI family type IV secretion system protein, partial [Klebsiella pneumoniae]